MTDVLEAPAPEAAPEGASLDGKALIDAVAAEMGWAPKDKWKGDPEKWRDSDAFLKATPAVLKSKSEQVERTMRMASQAIERAQRQAIADAEARIEAAAEAGDKDGVKEATRELREASKPIPQELRDFVARNPWYQTDHAATQVAIAAAEKVMQTGGSVADQIAAGEKEVRKRFPELFGDEATEEQPSRQAPAVQGGQRTAASAAPRKRGWSDLPPAVRDAQERHFVRKGLLTKEEAAEAYWQENP